MSDTLKLEQLDKYQKYYTKKNDGIGALESLLKGISNDGNASSQEIRSIAYSMYEEFHSDKKKGLLEILL